MCDNLRSDSSFSSTSSVKSNSSECEFPLFRQRFWFAATWTDDVGDLDRIQRQERMRSVSQRSLYSDVGDCRSSGVRTDYSSLSTPRSSRSSYSSRSSSKLSRYVAAPPATAAYYSIH